MYLWVPVLVDLAVAVAGVELVAAEVVPSGNGDKLDLSEVTSGVLLLAVLLVLVCLDNTGGIPHSILV